jgi:uncharacterized protein YggE
MKLFIKLSLILTIFFLFNSCIQTNKTDSVITVFGSGEMSFLPNVMNLRIDIKNVDADLTSAGNKTKTTLAEFTNLCNSYSIVNEDIRTSNIKTGKEFEYNSETRKNDFVGYSSAVTTIISVKDFSQFEEFSGLLFQFDDVSIGNFEFTHSDIKKYESDADLLALDNAKASAEKIAEHMNLKLDKILDISYVTIQNPFTGQLALYDRQGSGLSTGGIPVTPGILTLSKQVQIKYRVK